MPTTANITATVSQPAPITASVVPVDSHQITITQPPAITPDIMGVGAKGDTGATGATGSQGIQGATGATGAQGSQGEQGVQGDAATIAVGTATTGAPGSEVTVTNSGTSGAAILDFSIPAGVQGEQGVQGIQGETGASITSGAFVSTDLVFTKDDATTVTIVDAAVTLKGDQGETGLTGATGATGSNGTNGTNGTDGADGASITSAAFVSDDIVFTKDDASTVTLTGAATTLKGETGTTGATGATGATGSTGATGEAGAAGVDGADGVGVPSGGTVGQLLTKDSSTEFDTSWQNPPVSVSVTTKGDLQTFSTVPAKIGVGTDGQILESRASETTGLKWVPAPQGTSFLVAQVFS